VAGWRAVSAAAGTARRQQRVNIMVSCASLRVPKVLLARCAVPVNLNNNAILLFSFFGNLAAYQTWVLGVRLRSAFPSRPYQTRVLLLTLTLYILCKENAPKPSLKARAGDNKCNTRNVTFRFDRGRAAGTIKYRPGATQPIIIYYTLPGIYMFEIQPISRRDPSTPPIPVVSP
jgi:hypothetical protein